MTAVDERRARARRGFGRQTVSLPLAAAALLGAATTPGAVPAVPASGGPAASVEAAGAQARDPAAGPAENALRGMVSPDGARWVTYDPFDPYPPPGVETAATFRIGPTRGTAPSVAITVPGVGRTIDAVHWIDSRFVLVEADLASSILDADRGTVADQVYGLQFTVAPDAERIAFRYGSFPRYFPEDDPPDTRVGLWFRRSTAAEGPGWASMEIYPLVRFPPIVDYGPPPLDQRHLLRSGFSWSPSGRRLAFIEDHGGSRWLVVVEITSAPSTGSAPAHRFAVAETIEDVASLRWSAEETAVTIAGPEGNLRWTIDAEGEG